MSTKNEQDAQVLSEDWAYIEELIIDHMNPQLSQLIHQTMPDRFSALAVYKDFSRVIFTIKGDDDFSDYEDWVGIGERANAGDLEEILNVLYTMRRYFAYLWLDYDFVAMRRNDDS